MFEHLVPSQWPVEALGGGAWLEEVACWGIEGSGAGPIFCQLRTNCDQQPQLLLPHLPHQVNWITFYIVNQNKSFLP